MFRLKATLLQARRWVVDRLGRVERLPLSDATEFKHVAAESRTRLWSEMDRAERALELGKVQNLRSALARIDGVEIPAGALFSFGRASRRRGYVWGQLREGCLFPAVGGGPI